MDEDTAYVEAVGSPRALASLQFMGLPIPQDRLGGVLRYQTDHDEVGRATSCGPRTSRLMVQALAREAIRLEVPVFNNTTGVRLLVSPRPARRSAGLLAIRPKQRTAENPLGLAVFLCDSLVIASGGPGELYRDSVYPRHCFGSLGLALEAGLEAVNLTESQFGIGTSRDGFPGISRAPTCSRCRTCSRSTIADASATFSPTTTERRANWRRTSSGKATSGLSTRLACSTSARASSTSPYSARRRRDEECSWISIAIRSRFRETPISILERLDPDVRAYLENSGALLEKPIDRLRKMNPLSIELYKRYKYDITRDPLEFAINNQHMNGGLAVDSWGETSLEGCYAVGEAAGTHGVTRPGGAALNAGQVFGTRCAERSLRGARTQDVAPGGTRHHRRRLERHPRRPSIRQPDHRRGDPERSSGSHERPCGDLCTAADVQGVIGRRGRAQQSDPPAGRSPIRGRTRAAQGAAMAADGDRFGSRCSPRSRFTLSEAGKPRGADHMQPEGDQIPLAPDRATYGISIPVPSMSRIAPCRFGANSKAIDSLRHAARPPTRPG